MDSEEHLVPQAYRLEFLRPTLELHLPTLGLHSPTSITPLLKYIFWLWDLFLKVLHLPTSVKPLLKSHVLTSTNPFLTGNAQ
eukprot:5029132-Amphidinium_carterae.1